MNRSKFMVAVLCVIMVLVISAVQASSQTVKIGMFGPFSGPVADSGLAMANAVKMGVEEINAQGGIKGVGKIEIIAVDSEYNPSVAINAVNKLINREKVVALIGDIGSTATLAAMGVSAKAGIPQISPTSASPFITQKGNKFFFRTASGDQLSGAYAANFALKDLKAKKICILNISDDYGKDGADVVEQTLKKAGTPALFRGQFTMGDKDFSGLLMKMKEIGPEVVILWGLYFDAANILRQASNLGIKFTMVGCDTLAYPKMIELGGEHANGAIGITLYCSTDSDPMIQRFAANYKSKYKDESDPTTALSYDTIYILAQAIERTKSTNPTKIRDALYGTDYTGVTGRTTFQKTGEPNKDVFPVIIRDGKLVRYFSKK